MTLISEQFQEEGRISDDYSLKITSAEIFEADTRANIDIQVSTAKKYPRNLKSVLENILFLATQDKETAESCFYALKRDGKIIRGGSIRLAEIISNCYGNLRASARIVANDGRMLTAQGIAWDLENNVAYSIEVKRKITDRNGKAFSEDMQVITANACCSIAIRNAIFKCVPLAITSRVQDRIKKVVLGTEKDFYTIRKSAVEHFEKQGVTVKTILALFEKRNVEELTREDVFDLRGIATAIKDGDTTIEQAFSIPSKSNALGKAHKSLSIPIDEAPAHPITEIVEPPASDSTQAPIKTDSEVKNDGVKKSETLFGEE